MSIDEHIGVIEDLKSTMSVCMPEPEKTEICTSLGEAIDTMRKYQKIREIVKQEDYDRFNSHNYYGDFLRVQDIRKVLEYGNVD